MKKVEALKKLMSGEKLTHKELVGSYIYMKDGQVVNDKGTVFNLQLAPDEGWELFKPKKETKTFDKTTALSEIMSGKRVKALGWDDNYIYIDDKGQIVDKNGDTFNFMATKEEEWILFVEKKEDIKNRALMEQIENLTKLVEALSKQPKAEGVEEVGLSKADREEMEQSFYGVTGSKVKEQFKSELESIKDKNSLLKVITKYIPYCWMGKKFATARAYYVDMRNILKDVLAESSYLDTALDLFMIPSEVHDEVKRAESKKVIKKINDRETFEQKEIEAIIKDLKTNLEKAMGLGKNLTAKLGEKEAKERFKKVGIPIAKQQSVETARANLASIYLGFVTGRRIGEILKTLEIVKVGKVWHFRGLSKKGAGDFSIPAVICDDDIKFVKKVLEMLREDLDTSKLTLREVNSKFNMSFNRSLKRIIKKGYTFHDLREIYAELCYLKNGKDKGTEREELDYKAKVLGHEIDRDRLLATEHYMTMKGE